MYETLSHLLFGIGVALQPQNLALMFLGAFLGTIVGVLPGIGPQGSVALLLPLIFGMQPATALIFLAAIYAGSQYGGSTTSILLNVPGESSSVVTTLDGYEMTKQGRAGPALAIAAVGSFIAGGVGVIGLTLIAPPLAEVALRFGPAEYFALMVLGLSTVTAMVGRSVAKSLSATVLGLMLSTVGLDLATGIPRYTFGVPKLMDGVDFLVLSLGLFAISEVMVSMEESEVLTRARFHLERIWLSVKDFADSVGAIIRGSLIGFIVGILPGAGPIIASFLSYNVERQISRHPERFGHGEIRGVAAPESANNGAVIGSLVPLLTMGIPGSATAALMFGGLLMLGVRPGPQLFTQHPEVAWGVIGSLYLGNVILLILNFPLVGLFVRLLYIPLAIMLPFVLALSFIGVYSVNQSVFDFGLMLVFGLAGYYMRRREYPLAPMVLAFVLGGQMEQNFRRSLMLSNGAYGIFVHSPLSTGLLVASLAILIFPIAMARLRRRPALDTQGIVQV